MNYYRRYVGDYLRDTARLSMVEHGAYTLMLDYYYADEQPLPLDHEEVCRMIRAFKPEERKAVDKILATYFEQAEDGYHNSRADQELHKATPLIEAARENGRKGGRRKNPPDNPPGSDTDNPTGNGGGTGGEPAGLPDGQHPPTSNHQPPSASHQPLSANRQGKTKGTRFALPEWVPPEAWSHFEAMRQRIRKPMTDRAKELIVGKLDTLRSDGHMPIAVLEQSVLKGWQDVYPISAQAANGKGNGASADLTERNRQRTADWVPPESDEVLG